MSTIRSVTFTTVNQINAGLKHFEISKELKIEGEVNQSINWLLSNSSNDQLSKSKQKRIKEMLD